MLRKPRRPRLVLVVPAVACTLALASCGRRAPSPATTPAGPSAGGGANAVVVRDVDGDTIRVRIGGREEAVRLIGIDTPETKDPHRPVMCFGREASARTTALLPPGTPVRLVRDVEQRDRYGRLLAYVYRARDGLFVNLSLARDGFAVAYTYPPNVAHTAEFVAAAADARGAGRGLWSACGRPDLPAP